MTEDTTVALRIMAIAELRSRAAPAGSALKLEWENVATACRNILKAPPACVEEAKAGQIAPRSHLRVVAPVDHLDV